jgi:hypothetical protein
MIPGRLIFLLALQAAPVARPTDAVRPAVQWTREPMLRACWGPWRDYGSAGKAFYFQKLAEVGIQVYVHSFAGDFSSANPPEEIQTDARFCRRYGLKFLVGVFTNTDLERRWARTHQVRLAVDATGKTSLDYNPDLYMPCPLAEEYWDFAYTQPALTLAELARTRVPGITGMHIDPEHHRGLWNFYRGIHTCYCDHCFGGYLRWRQRPLAVPPASRYRWLERRGELQTYWRYLEEEAARRAREVERRVHQRAPDFLFAASPGIDLSPPDWFLRGMARGLHTPAVPLLVFDASHDNDIDWSRSPAAWYRRHGMVHLEGHWIERIEKNCPQIPLAQAFAESGLHADGYWVRWEKPLTSAHWNALSQANLWLQGIAAKVGEFLRTPPDERFVRVEPLGEDLDWDGIIQARTYHLGNRHLLHLSNLSLEESPVVRIRWVKLGTGPPSLTGSYALVNPIEGKAYVPRAGVPPAPAPPWTVAQLEEGVPVPVAARSETFLLLQPATGGTPAYPVGATRDQVLALWSERQRQRSHQTAGPVRLSQPLGSGLLRLQTATQEVWINPVRGGQVWRWHEKQRGNELAAYDHGGLYGGGLFKDVLLPGEAGLAEAAEGYAVVSHRLTPDRAVVVLERHLTPDSPEFAAFSQLSVHKTIRVENAVPRLTVEYRLTNTGETPLSGHLTLRQSPRLAERARPDAGPTVPPEVGLIIPTPGGLDYLGFLPQSVTYATPPEAPARLGANGFAQFCPLTQEGVRWEFQREQLDSIQFWKFPRETYVFAYHPFVLAPRSTWRTTLSVVYEPHFEVPKEWRE